MVDFTGLRNFVDRGCSSRESDFSNLDSSLNKDSSPNTKSPNRENSLSAESFKSFEDLCKEIDWSKVFKPEPQKRASWLASIDESGNLVVINSEGKKDLNSKILENPFLLIANENTKVDDRIEVNSNTISGVIRIISNEEMNKRIAKNGDAKDAKVDDKKNQEIIITPLDLSFASFRTMMGKYDEKAVEKMESSFVSKHPSIKDNNAPINLGKGR
jgi:hypothetical protein